MHKQNFLYLKHLHFVFLSVHVSVFLGKYQVIHAKTTCAWVISV